MEFLELNHFDQKNPVEIFVIIDKIDLFSKGI